MSSVKVVRGLNNSGIPPRVQSNVHGTISWTNAVFSPTQLPSGTEPLTMLLRMLKSTGTASSTAPLEFPGWNGAGDFFPPGIGLGIPADHIDSASFVTISEALDWDLNQQLCFHFTRPVPAKEFIDEELCRPFGLYLIEGNDGLIRCKRSRHPQKFYIGGANRQLTVTDLNGQPLPPYNIPIGVYTAEELAAQVSSEWFPLSYSGSTNRFTVGSSETPFFQIVLSADRGWQQLGFTSGAFGNHIYLADTPMGALSTSTPLLTKSDMSAVQLIDNRADQITSVIYMFDYDVDTDFYQSHLRYSDGPGGGVGPYGNLGDSFGTRDYVIKSKGLISGSPTSASWVVNYDTSSSSCTPATGAPSSETGVDANTWSLLNAKTLLDRYKNPPLKFRARLTWKWNTLEVGDIVQVVYDIPGVLVDFELGADTIGVVQPSGGPSRRLFEVVELHPNFDGSLEATFLGHRYVGY